MNRDKVTVAQIEVCETAKKMYHSGLVAEHGEIFPLV